MYARSIGTGKKNRGHDIVISKMMVEVIVEDVDFNSGNIALNG